MKSIGIITFHASHNYGSMLQAFALQKIIQESGFYCEILNLRTKTQRDIYTPVTLSRGGTVRTRLKRILSNYYRKNLRIKYERFENFLKQELNLSVREYNNLQELEDHLPHYDFYIAGSDQIWNTSCKDFCWAYFLPFQQEGKKIAYAPSMGPVARQEILDCDKIAGHVKNFDCLSARERGTADILEKLLHKRVQIVLDPTLLLKKEIWFSCIQEKPLVEGNYIFLYSPHPNDNVYRVAYDLARLLKMQVVVSLLNIRCWLFYPSFRMELAVGPWEFLNLLKNARLVCCGSYHAVIFSILFQIPFFAVGGMCDNRMKELLGKFHFEKRSITLKEIDLKAKTALDMDFQETENVLQVERQKSIDFLIRALNTDK